MKKKGERRRKVCSVGDELEMRKEGKVRFVSVDEKLGKNRKKMSWKKVEGVMTVEE